MKTWGFLEHRQIGCYLSHTFIEITALYFFFVPILIELVVYRIFLVCENPEYVNLDIRVRTVLTPVVWVRDKHFASFINKFNMEKILGSYFLECKYTPKTEDKLTQLYNNGLSPWSQGFIRPSPYKVNHTS